MNKLLLLLGLMCSLHVSAYEKEIELLFPESPLAYAQVVNMEKYAKLDKVHPLKNLLANKVFQRNILPMFFNKADKSEFEKEIEDFVVKKCTKRLALALLTLGQADGEGESAKVVASRTANSIQFGISPPFQLSPKSFDYALAADCTATAKE